MGAKRQQNEDHKSPAVGRGWLLALGLLCALGLADSLYLSVLHWQVHVDPSHVSFCAINQEVNCDTVAMSPHSLLFGLPISTWGLLFYSLLGVLVGWGLIARRPPFPWALAGGLNAAACGLTAYLFLISEFDIQSLCVLCMGLYGINLASAFVCVLGGRRVGLPPATTASWPLLGLLLGTGVHLVLSSDRAAAAWPAWAALGGGCLLALVALNVSGGLDRLRVWARVLRSDLAVPFSRRLRAALVTGLAVAGVAAAFIVTQQIYPQRQTTIAGGTEDIGHGQTESGHAWIGAARPEVTIYEYSDYECPFCRKAHEEVRHAVRQHKGWLRLVHIHMPLDQACNPMLSRPFHRHSCVCARAAICAAEQDAFWPMNDRLFLRRGGLDTDGLINLATQMGLDAADFRGCMRAQRSREELAADLAECRRLGLRPATPTFRIDEQMVVGLKDRRWWSRAAKRRRARRRQPNGAAADGAEPATAGRGGPDGTQKRPVDRR